MALVEINKVKKEFGEELLFKDVTFSIENSKGDIAIPAIYDFASFF